MKRKVVIIGLVLILGFVNLSYAQIRKNAYQIHTWSSVTKNASTTITFPYESRDLIIYNGDASDAVLVDVTGTNTSCTQQTAGCFLLPAVDSLELYDYGVSSINIITWLVQASPISVVVTY